MLSHGCTRFWAVFEWRNSEIGKARKRTHRRGNFKYARSKICSASGQLCDDCGRLLWRNVDAPHQRQEGLKDESKNIRTQMQEFKQAITSLLENTDNFLADSTSGACNWLFRSFRKGCTFTSRCITVIRPSRSTAKLLQKISLAGNYDYRQCRP